MLHAALIVKNEEECLEKCLKSLAGFDSINIVDTGSTDRTVEIAKQYNAKISFREWDGNFSNARNFGLAQIPSDEWVFIIDADEWLEHGELEKIKSAIKSSRTGRCFAHVLNVVDGHHHQHLRFFINNLRYKDAAHNHIPVTDWDFTDVVIKHSPSVNHLKDPLRTLRILEKIKNKSPREKFLIGREYLNQGNYKEAVKWLEEYLKNEKPNQLVAEGFLYLSQAYFQLKRDDDAKRACYNAIEINPEFKEALIAMATYHEPRQMLTWLKFADAADNFGLSSIHGLQEERIKEFRKISELALSGKKYKDIFEKRSIEKIKTEAQNG